MKRITFLLVFLFSCSTDQTIFVETLEDDFYVESYTLEPDFTVDLIRVRDRKFIPNFFVSSRTCEGHYNILPRHRITLTYEKHYITDSTYRLEIDRREIFRLLCK